VQWHSRGSTKRQKEIVILTPDQFKALVQKLVTRIKRIRGQVDSIERTLTTGDDCADVLMLLATVRGGVNSLMAEVLEDHIRHHLLSGKRSSAPPEELAEDMIDLVRAYLK
jgi:DNA-binding FrmR family transcriptional regulator